MPLWAQLFGAALPPGVGEEAEGHVLEGAVGHHHQPPVAGELPRHRRQDHAGEGAGAARHLGVGGFETPAPGFRRLSRHLPVALRKSVVEAPRLVLDPFPRWQRERGEPVLRHRPQIAGVVAQGYFQQQGAGV